MPPGCPAVAAPAEPAPEPIPALAVSDIDATLAQAQMLLKLGDLEGAEAAALPYREVVHPAVLAEHLPTLVADGTATNVGLRFACI